MDGIIGLQLLDTVQKICNNGWDIPLIIFGGILTILMLIFLIIGWDSDERKQFIVSIIISITILLAGLYIHFYATESYNEYKCVIVDENYHIDLGKYEIITIEGKLITLKDKID